MELITVYLRRVKFPKLKTTAVFVYRDRECYDLFAKFKKDIVPLPNKRRKTITLNCNNYKVEWLD